MEKSGFYKLKKHLIRLVAYFILIPLGFMATVLDGYGWKAFLLRLCVVVLSLKFNSFDDTLNYTSSGAMKLFLLTCAILAYAICKLIYDYSKAGKEAEAKMRNEQAR